jgi:hypothetical protein
MPCAQTNIVGSLDGQIDMYQTRTAQAAFGMGKFKDKVCMVFAPEPNAPSTLFGMVPAPSRILECRTPPTRTTQR